MLLTLYDENIFIYYAGVFPIKPKDIPALFQRIEADVRSIKQKRNALRLKSKSK